MKASAWRYPAVGGYLLLLWPAALWLGWLLLAALDFMYPLAYRWLDIASTLQAYVPQNRCGRQDFPLHDAAQHFEMFAAIAQAIHAQGAGLESLSYRDAAGKPLGLLLTRDEVLHLQDVARLVSAGMVWGMGATLAWLLALAIALRRGWRLPGQGELLAVTALALTFGAALLLGIGPTKAFYAWHHWVFPPGHPWFFYYQDSLMSSLMQAPNLFAVIGAFWVMASVSLLLALNAAGLLLSRFFTTRRTS